MRFASSLALSTLAFAALSHAAFINLPPLYSCEPATIQVLAKGNYTLEGRELDSHKVYFHLRVQKGVSSVTWDAVDLAADATALISVTDQISASQTAVGSVQAVIQPNPSGNTTCLASDKKGKNHTSAKQKNMVPTIIGIVLGAFFLLVLLLVAGMMYRRKKEKSQKIEEDSVDLSHNYTQAGGSYMARLVPGLKPEEARPLPRDHKLESEQANYASTRRGTQYYRNGAGAADLDNSNAAAPASGGAGIAGYELPNYNQSQRHSRLASNPHQQPYSVYAPNQQQEQQQRWQQPAPVPAAADPFASQNDLPGCYQLPHQMYRQNSWQHSQTSFLDKQNSR
ncbi:hypothetical protein EX895_003318 [Sporisorium graminicola]|uniref:Mid2 domain-containing protein n=1 Tax=Sporisorium graminicola TaxID=280036 RepID=A0A4U7KUF5_9BASI|nr:hypothetical protein EX895_003318 [Sporisorium graminicola]TKY87737.1 hypothetical protein EX895_003318 [Sporisorium graminicola]